MVIAGGPWRLISGVGRRNATAGASDVRCVDEQNVNILIDDAARATSGRRT